MGMSKRSPVTNETIYSNIKARKQISKSRPFSRIQRLLPPYQLHSPQRSQKMDEFRVSFYNGPAGGTPLPYIYIDRIFHELRPELLSAMHSALEGQNRNGPIDVDRLYRAFTRAAAGKCSTPQRVSEKCVTETSTARTRRAKDARIDE
jgi:hypothetical protein